MSADALSAVKAPYGPSRKTRWPGAALAILLVKSPRLRIVISTCPSVAATLEENEKGWPVI